MSRFLSWLLIGALFVLFAVTVGWVLKHRADAGKGLPDYSVYSREADGLADSAEFLRRVGFSPIALTRPVQSPRQRGLLLLVEPEFSSFIPGFQGDFSAADVLALRRWVEAGNTLVFACNRETALHRDLGIEVIRSDEEAATEVELSASPYLAGVEKIVVGGQHSLRSGKGLPLWYVGSDPGAVLVRQGRGRIMVIADPSLWTSQGLRRGDNAVLLYNVATLHARGDRIYYDEYHHGLRSESGFFGYLRHHDRQWTVWPVLAVVGIVLWAWAIRLGPATPTPGQPRADAVDYASAVARIYRQANTPQLMARLMVRGFLATLTRHLRLRRAALPAEILAAWRDRHSPDSTKRLQSLLRSLNALRTKPMPNRQLLAWCRAFDDFLSEVTHAR